MKKQIKSRDNYRVIISGGGTGGHIFPAISIADSLSKLVPGIEILFVGADGKMEMERVPAAGYKIEGLPIAGLKRSLSLSNLLLPYKIWKSVRLAGKIIEKFEPNVVVGVGGYASAPLLWSARIRKIPYIIQEQNSYAGLTNKFLGSGASLVCVAFEEMEQFFPKEKIMITGNPVRSNINKASSEERFEAVKALGLDPSKKTIFVTGGSLGARTLNNCAKSWIDTGGESDIQMIWQYGKIYRNEMESFLNERDLNWVKGCEFVREMNQAYAAADLVITRAGAGTISELAVAGKASLFVPSPNVAEDHQTHNALSLVNKGAAVMVSDHDAPGTLFKTAVHLVRDSETINKLESKIFEEAKPFASDIIAEEIIKLFKK